jgi:TRAP-type uncharacterized transport system substrate-binding protein
MLTIFTEYFGLTRLWSLVAACLVFVVVGSAVLWFICSAPPHELVITSGPEGSTYERYAEKYQALLASNGVTLKIVPSQGSEENLERLEDDGQHVDIGFVQGGTPDGTNLDRLFSLGSISYQPLLIFYRSTNSMRLLSELNGKRIAIGAVGSGTHSLALALLQTNGVTAGGSTQLEEIDADAAAKGLLGGTIDAAFMMGDSTSLQTMRTLLRAPEVRLMSFEQADAYTRRFNFLNKLRLPEGSIDLGKNLPAQDVWLIGPSVELVARDHLNAALSDLLLDAATDVHGKAGLLQNQGDFPAPLVHEFKISPDATRYYKSGKKILYRWMPFWLASLSNRVLVAFIPMMLVLIPTLKMIPSAYKWRIQLHIYRWYRKLIALERELEGEVTPPKRAELSKRLDEIEKVVAHMKVPASFANQFYTMRQHIDFVKELLHRNAGPA